MSSRPVVSDSRMATVSPSLMASAASGIFKPDNADPANPDLPLLSVPISVALIKGLHPAAERLDEETFERGINDLDLALACGAGQRREKLGCQGCVGHIYLKINKLS